MASLLAELGRLVLPVSCAGCGAYDQVICARCLALLAASPWRCEDAAGRLDRMDGRPPLPVWALTPYTGPMRELVVAWKDRGRTDVRRPLEAAVERGARSIAPALRAGLGARPTPGTVPSDRSGWPGGAATDVILIVPAPSTAAARRRRGEDPVARLARAAARGCAREGLSAVAAPVLVRRGRGRDQVGLGSRARARNLAGHVFVRRRAVASVAGRTVLMIDDVLTTGATLAACAQALAAAGAVVIGALTVAATPPPGRTTREVEVAADRV